ncbi:MAG: glucose-6-phosphate isomerase [Candidatus Woesearchaeota archaeon]|nr:glucose-6-phosphate isomerase [Candidatus Woesearchaeota archaeon]MDN5328159.1 glucose-6-phosphate isomerase [Candidatus Woesearchaeota archaeon]
MFLKSNYLKPNMNSNETLTKINLEYFPDFKSKFSYNYEEPYFFSKAKKLLESLKSIRQNKQYKSFILIGNGGSINPLLTLYYPFKPKNKNILVLNSEDPYLIKKALSLNKKNSLVIAISKSGETSTVIFNYLTLSKYDSVVITSNKKSTLAKLAIKRKAKLFFCDKKISGRFSGFSESTLIPLQFLGLNLASVKKIINGALKVDFKEAFKLAEFLYKNEKKGYTTLYIPIYSTQLNPLFLMLSQLFHETFGKNKKGLTIYGGLAPETQHHSNQRFFGGRKDSQALIIYAKSNENFKLNKDLIPNIKYNGYSLRKLSDIDFNDLVKKECLGTLETAVSKNIPTAYLTTEISYENIGLLLMFFYMTSYYSALLRKVNPFNQPDVELSKEQALKEIFGFK